MADYSPEDNKQEDIPLKKGDIVQCIASNAGWLFVIKTRAKNNNEQEQGWVPEAYLERVYKNGGNRELSHFQSFRNNACISCKIEDLMQKILWWVLVHKWNNAKRNIDRKAKVKPGFV